MATISSQLPIAWNQTAAAGIDYAAGVGSETLESTFASVTGGLLELRWANTDLLRLFGAHFAGYVLERLGGRSAVVMHLFS